MDLADLLRAQLTDPFRWGLIVALVATMHRTRGVTGQALPLVAGVAFVALIVPMTLGALSGAALARAAGVGVVANALILAVVLGVRGAFVRLRR